MSPSSRGRGLKYLKNSTVVQYRIVALFTRAWIEIMCLGVKDTEISGRPLHEGVD